MNQEEIQENQEIKITTFDDFAKSLQSPEPEQETVVDIDKIKEVEGEGLKCPYCNWKTHKNAKNKQRGLKSHISKCSQGSRSRDY